MSEQRRANPLLRSGVDVLGFCRTRQGEDNVAVFRFGPYDFRPDAGELLRHGTRIHLREQSMRLLLVLIERAGLVVTRDELRGRLWPDGTFTDFDRAINKIVSELRDRLHDSSSMPRFIETHSKRGYRFIALVEPGPSAAATTGEQDGADDAHIACAIGHYLWNRRSVGDLHASLRHFAHALEVAPGCASAHAGVAYGHVLLGIWGLQPADGACASARRAAVAALAIEPNLADAHTSMADVAKGYDWDWALAERRYRHALTLAPRHATAHQWYAQLLVSLGRHRDAIWHIEQARRADPISPAINAYLPYIYLASRQFDRALREAQAAVELEPQNPLAHWQLGRAHIFSGHPERAVQVLTHAARMSEASSMWEAELCFAVARSGDRADACARLSALIERARRVYVSPYDLAIAFVGMGERGAALECLDRAVDERVMRVGSLGDPEFDDLRTDPRFRHLANRLRLPAA